MATRTASWLRRTAGFSIVEVTTVISALSILTGAAAPAVNDYVEQAKQIRAIHDVKTINVSLARLLNDTGAERNIEKGWATYDLLVGDGAVPQTNGPGTEPWTLVGAHVGLLDDQLVNNGAGYATDRRSAPFGWRGAYLDQSVGSDPWGQRYAVNVRTIRTPGADMVVISAGSDGIVESVFEIDGLPTRGDDVVSVVATGRGR